MQTWRSETWNSLHITVDVLRTDSTTKATSNFPFTFQVTDLLCKKQLLRLKVETDFLTNC